jgi:hypothetical protein
MSSVIHLNPEVLELVREIAARPDSVLLRIPRGAEARALREDRPLASATDSALSRAERHLVAVYREEVAYVLRCAAWYLIATSEWGQRHVNRAYSHGKMVEVPTLPGLTKQASVQLRAARRESIGDPAFTLIQTLSDPASRISCRLEALCSVAHRLVPTASGRMFAGMASQANGRVELARALYIDAWRAAPTSDTAAAALQNIAELVGQSDKVETALDLSVRAHESSPTMLSPLVSTLWYSIRMGDVSRAERAMSELEVRAAEAADLFSEQLRRFVNYAPRLSRSLDRESRTVLQRLLARPVKSVGGMLHALG